MKTTAKQRKYAREFQRRMVASGLCIAGCMKPIYKWQRCRKHYLDQRSRNRAWFDLNAPLTKAELVGDVR